MSVGLLAVLVGCAGISSSPPGPLQLTIGRVGDKWDMRETKSGHITHFELLPMANVGCAKGNLIDMRITKDNPEDYWQVGLAGGADDWILQQNAAGDWQAVATYMTSTAPDNDGWPYTIDYVHDTYSFGGNDPNSAYLVVPSSFSKPVTRYGSAQWWLSNSEVTPACLENVGQKGADSPWTSVISQITVDTPAYSGPAVANDEYEGCHSDNLPQCVADGAAHEIWVFAPGLGLVEINAVWEGVELKRIVGSPDAQR